MIENIKIGIGLQICRPDKIPNIIHHLSFINGNENFCVEIVIDRENSSVENILSNTSISKTYTGGIGNWTSKNFLIRKLLQRGADLIILLEDDIEILKEGLFEYIKICYLYSKGVIGYFKLNNDYHKMKFNNSLVGNKAINGINFHLCKDLNTSALLVFHRNIIEDIGYFCNSYYEVGFHDYRERLYGAKLIEYFLVPSNLNKYLMVDDSISSTVNPKDSAIYWNQKFAPSINWYRPYNDKPALIL